MAAVDIAVRAREQGVAQAFNAARQQVQSLTAVASRATSIFRAALGASAVVAGLRSLANAVSNAIDALDNLDKAAQRAGVGVESLQSLQQLGELGGAAINVTNVALQRFTRRLGDAASGTGTLLPVLTEMGIEVRNVDGSLRDTDAVLNDFQRGLQGLSTSAEVNRAAFAAFDSEGLRFGIALRNAGQSVDAFREQQIALGLVVREETVANAVAAKDSFTQLGAVVGTATLEFFAPLSTHLREAADSLLVFLNAADEATLFRNAIDNINDFTNTVDNFDQTATNAARAARQNFEGLGTNVANAMQQIRLDLARGFDPSAVEEQSSALVDAVAGAVQQLGQSAPDSEVYQELLELLAQVTEQYNRVRQAAADAADAPDTSDVEARAAAIRDQIASREQEAELNERIYAQLVAEGELSQEQLAAARELLKIKQDEAQSGSVLGQQVLDNLEAAERTRAVKVAELGLQRTSGELSQEAYELALRRLLVEEDRGEQQATEAQALIATLRAEEERLATIVAELGLMRTRNEISEEEYQLALRRAGVGMTREQTLRVEVDLLEQQLDVTQSVLGVLQGFEDSTEGWLNLLRDGLSVFAQFQQQGGGGFGDFLTAFGRGFTGGGGRHGGGAVAPGLSYTVGESGRELFVPRVAGHIIPAGSGSLAGGGTTVINNVNRLNGDATVQTQQALIRSGNQIAALLADVEERRLRGGGV